MACFIYLTNQLMLNLYSLMYKVYPTISLHLVSNNFCCSYLALPTIFILSSSTYPSMSNVNSASPHLRNERRQQSILGLRQLSQCHGRCVYLQSSKLSAETVDAAEPCVFVGRQRRWPQTVVQLYTEWIPLSLNAW